MSKLRFPVSWIDPALGLAARVRAQQAYRRLLCEAQNAVLLQERALLGRIRNHAESEFGRDHGFAAIRGYDDFRSAVPVRDYEQLRPYIQRVMDGNVRALFGRHSRILMFAMTSGSTDRPKYIPITPQFVRDYRRGWNAFGGRALLDHPEAFMRGILQVTSPIDVERTALGIPCGSISGLLAREQSTIVRRFYVTPSEVAAIPDAESRYYTIMRFALPRDVGWIVTASPATPLKLAKTAAMHAQRLIRDIHDGTLAPPQALPRPLAESLEARLKPDPQAAARLDTLSARSQLMPSHYWRLAFLANWTGGTLALHLRDFPGYFGAAPVRDIGLLATEGRVSIGLGGGTPVGLMDVGAGFFEFAELDGGSSAAVRRCHELDTGGVYRVIMTNAAGLYRYDIGDCVRVAGYEGQAPLLEFLHRGARVSSMTGEKLSEWQVTRAMELAVARLGVNAANFVVAPAWDQPPFYRLYLESGDPIHGSLAQRIEEELARVNIEYASKRHSSRLGPIQLQTLPAGSLARWDLQCMQRHRSGEQYKHQYLFTAPGDDAPLFEMSRPSAGLPRLMGTMAEPDTEMASP